MIRMFNGTPGSGKSLHMAKIIKSRSYFGHTTIGNFEVDKTKLKHPEAYVEVDNSELTPDYLRKFSKQYFKGRRPKESQIVLMIDEAQILFNAREWNKPNRKDWIDFYTNHRKYGYDIILICQFPKMLDTQVRSLVEYQTIHRKVSNYGIAGKLIKLLTLGEVFVQVEVWYPINEKVGSAFFKAHKRDYSLYDTFNTFDSKDDDKEE